MRQTTTSYSDINLNSRNKEPLEMATGVGFDALLQVGFIS